MKRWSISGISLVARRCFLNVWGDVLVDVWRGLVCFRSQTLNSCRPQCVNTLYLPTTLPKKIQYNLVSLMGNLSKSLSELNLQIILRFVLFVFSRYMQGEMEEFKSLPLSTSQNARKFYVEKALLFSRAHGIRHPIHQIRQVRKKTLARFIGFLKKKKYYNIYIYCNIILFFLQY